MDSWVYMFIQRAFSKHVPTMSRAPCADAYIYPNYVSRAINKDRNLKIPGQL